MVGRNYIPTFLLVLVNVLFFIFCWHHISWQSSYDYELKMKAVGLAIRAQKIIGSQMIGEEYTPMTTTLGSYDAKHLSTHPDFAAVAVDMLQSVGIRAGDQVAVNMSSSFPALNIAVIAAVDTIGATPIIVSSVGSSTWGANRPDFTWLDMEKKLVDEGLWSWRSRAVGRGGGGDQGNGLTPEGLEMITTAIERSGLPLLEGFTLGEAITGRVQLYERANQGILPKVLVNIGGSHVIFGEQGHDGFLHQGVTQGYHPYLSMAGGLAAQFVNANRSVIHFININRLAAHYEIKMGEIGKSRVFHSRIVPVYLRIVIGIWLVGVLVCMWYGKGKKWWQL